MKNSINNTIRSSINVNPFLIHIPYLIIIKFNTMIEFNKVKTKINHNTQNNKYKYNFN